MASLTVQTKSDIWCCLVCNVLLSQSQYDWLILFFSVWHIFSNSSKLSIFKVLLWKRMIPYHLSQRNVNSFLENICEKGLSRIDIDLKHYPWVLMFPLQALERVVPRLRLLSRDEQLEVRDSFFKWNRRAFMWD